ncbi:MAG TPA: hypothetical protein P5257_09805 [Bacteroidales bacterium]|nr:hypothetical protein [Bacteroidales bacterium]HRT90398.1 hypothetical protein [Bacteroidales bacterium]
MNDPIWRAKLPPKKILSVKGGGSSLPLLSFWAFKVKDAVKRRAAMRIPEQGAIFFLPEFIMTTKCIFEV